jgi:chemotaxis signal transduction protein
MTMADTDVHVKVRAGGETYAFAIGCVRSVAALGDVTALPGADRGVLGVRNVHGQVLPVIDLAHALGLAGGGAPERMVVAEASGCMAGLAVDEVLEVGELPNTRSEAESDYLSEAVLDDGALVGIVRLERLFAGLRGDRRP